MIDKNRAYCLSGAFTPLLIGYSVSSFKEGAAPFGLIIGGVAIISTPFVLKYLTPFALQYAEMLSSFFYPPINPPTILISKGSLEKIQPAIEDLRQTAGSPIENCQVLKTLEKRRSFQFSSPITPLRRQSLEGRVNTGFPVGIEQSPLEQKQSGIFFDFERRQSLGGKRASIGSVGFHTPLVGVSPSNSRTHSPVPHIEEEIFGTEDYIKYLRGLGDFWQQETHLIDPCDLFYFNLSLGAVKFLQGGTKSVKGIPNGTILNGSPLTDNSHIISALQALCHNRYFLTQLNVGKSSFSSDQKRLLGMLQSLVRSFKGESSTDLITYKMTQIKEIAQKINQNESNDPVEFIGSVFRALNINNFTLLKAGSDDASPQQLQILRVPATENSLAENMELFFSNQAFLQGPLPDLFTIEFSRVDEDQNTITKEIEVEEEIDLGPYLKEQKEKSLYKITAAICYLKKNPELNEGRYVTFVRSEGKWLLCDDDEVCEVSRPYLKGASALVFEKTN